MGSKHHLLLLTPLSPLPFLFIWKTTTHVVHLIHLSDADEVPA